MDLRFAVFILTRIELSPTWRFYSARLGKLERFVLKETRIELLPTWRFYLARLVRLEGFVLKETTHIAEPHEQRAVHCFPVQFAIKKRPE